MSTWQSDRIVSNGIQIHYTRTGGDKPPLVLAHGFSDDGLCWTPVAEILTQTHDVIMVDARGHGFSDAPKAGYNLMEMAEDLAGVITGLHMHKPALLGHSMGGATIYMVAGLYPELPGAILIEDSGMRNLTAGRTAEAAERQRQMQARMSELQSKTQDQLIALCRLSSPTWSEAELGPWADAKLRFNPRALQRLGSTVDDWKTIVSKITCPALLITADVEQGAMVSTEDAAALQQLIPQLEVTQISNAGHNIRREQFALYMKVVQAFLGHRINGI